jgi:hypothetical protein
MIPMQKRVNNKIPVIEKQEARINNDNPVLPFANLLTLKYMVILPPTIKIKLRISRSNQL